MNPDLKHHFSLWLLRYHGSLDRVQNHLYPQLSNPRSKYYVKSVDDRRFVYAVLDDAFGNFYMPDGMDNLTHDQFLELAWDRLFSVVGVLKVPNPEETHEDHDPQENHSGRLEE